MPIFEMNSNSTSLEEIFLTLTGQQQTETEKMKLQKNIEAMDEKTEVEQEVAEEGSVKENESNL